MRLRNVWIIWTPQWHEVGEEPWPVLCMDAGFFEVWCRFNKDLNAYNVCVLQRYGDDSIFAPCVGNTLYFSTWPEAEERMHILADLLIKFSDELDKLTMEKPCTIASNA